MVCSFVALFDNKHKYIDAISPLTSAILATLRSVAAAIFQEIPGSGILTNQIVRKTLRNSPSSVDTTLPTG